jgi:predicted Fe-S protein YdhL (DUF1289 family)
MDDRGPASPCINVCSLDDRGVCRGCFRTLADIADWTRMTAADRRAAVERADARRIAAEQERERR